MLAAMTTVRACLSWAFVLSDSRATHSAPEKEYNDTDYIEH